MRIIVDTGLNLGPYEYSNVGDVSMLQVAVTRLQKLWPAGIIEVISDSPENLAMLFPEAKALAGVGREIWVGDKLLLGALGRFLPRSVTRRLITLKRVVGLYWPSLLKLIIYSRLKLQNRTAEIVAVSAFVEAITKADLLVLCGAGGFFDNCRVWNMEKLDTMEAAKQRRIPIVMFGQSMGPLTDSEVLARARKILPFVHLITLRGSRGGMAVLESMGVEISGVQTTGDEAVELAYEARPGKIGHALGVNLRIAASAEVGQTVIETIKPILQKFARSRSIAILPIPIACHPYAKDHETIKQLLAGFEDQSDGGVNLDTPLKVIRQTGQCRVVVTGAYHGAVFALAQGIPVVCLASSPYYVTKFLGLEDQFGAGCKIVLLTEPDLPQKLTLAIEKTWESAEIMHKPLQLAAVRQIDASRYAYNQVKDMIAGVN